MLAMKNLPNAVLILILLFCFRAVSASEPVAPKNIALNNYPAVVAFLNQYIEYLVDEEDIAGLSVAIVNGNHVIWEKGFGYANVDLKIKAKANTVYQAGAVTGLLTAALIVELSEKKLLDLDDNIKQYLPALKIHSRFQKTPTITIRQLLTHHAGLPINIFKDSWSEKPPGFSALLRPETNLNASFPPGHIYAFSNIGYSLLGLIIEKATNLSYSKAMEQYILEPMNMSSSSVDNENELHTKLAIGYKKGEPGKRLSSRDTPSVGLVTTVKDLSRFVRRYFSGNDALAETIKVQNPDVEFDVERQVGFSWYIGGMNIEGGGPIIWRGGATPYFRSRVAMLPEHELGIAILSNDTRSWEVISQISEKALQLMLEAKAGITQPVGSDEPDKKKIITSAAHIKAASFSKAYSSFVGYIPTIKEGDEYRANILGWSFLLNEDERNKHWFTLQYDLLGFIPIDISWISGVKVRAATINKQRVIIVYYKGRQYLFGIEHLTSEIHPAWRNVLGEYTVKNTDVLLESMKVKEGELLIRDNQLLFVYELPLLLGTVLEIPVKTISNEQAIIPGLGTGLNETVRIMKAGENSVLEYSGYLLEKAKADDALLNFELFE